jgi:hypothetical protein
MTDWTDRIVGDRMKVDRKFNDRIQDSQFSSQEWGLIMTATELDIEHADDPRRARIIANTEKLPNIMPELDNVRSQMTQMSGSPAENGTGSSRGGGFVGMLKNVLGLSDGDDSNGERLAAAEQLTQDYADELQRHLESENRWEQVRTSYLE